MPRSRRNFRTSPEHWFSDEERVVVLTRIAVGGEEADSPDVLTFRGGKVVKFQTAGPRRYSSGYSARSS